MDNNHIMLIGRLSGAPEERELPSGDRIVVFRVVVERPTGGRVDTIDCAVHTATLRKRMLRMDDGTRLQIEGSLHRRFWRSPVGPTSRYEVVARQVARSA